MRTMAGARNAAGRRAMGGKAGKTAASGRFDAVDSLRAIAMIAVIAQHADLFPFGWMGVQLFFVISGFVVTVSVVDRKDAGPGGWAALRDFYRRRVARIMPAYYAYVLLAMALTVLIEAPFDAPARLAQVVYTYNFHQITRGEVMPPIPTSHLWSLSVEMQFYLLFGPVLILAPRRWLAPGLIATIVLVTLTRLAWGWHVDNLRQVDFVSPWQFDAFSAGALLALWRERITSRAAGWLLLGGIMAMALYYGGYMAVNWHFGARGGAVVQKILSGNSVGQGRAAVMFTPIMLLSAGVVASAATAGTRLSRWLSRPALVAVGRASYSGYLIHFLVLAAFQMALSVMFGVDWSEGRSVWGLATKVLLVLLVTPATIVLADLMYRHFEVPAAQVVNRWLAPRERQARPGVAMGA